jgi:UDP:flavonoid glycosyltransferase YjiC (YdhE family)
MKVLAYTSPARGHLYPLIPILLELRSRGHEVAVRTFADEVEHVRQLGLSVTATAPAICAPAGRWAPLAIELPVSSPGGRSALV